MDRGDIREMRPNKNPINPIIPRIIDGSYCSEVQQSHFPRDLPATEYQEGVNSKAVTMFKRGACEKHVTNLNEIEKMGQLMKPNKESTVSRRGGLDTSSQVIFNNLNNSCVLEQDRDISIETSEVKYLAEIEPVVTEDRKTTEVSREVTLEAGNQLTETIDRELGKMETDNAENKLIEAGERNSLTTVREWEIEEVEPLQIQQQQLIIYARKGKHHYG
ncbi:hypothetical protein FXO37_09293 [Capsicum annuum]|nr:hypothetical protein FXO37_09293 [Capsicum annuum]